MYNGNFDVTRMLDQSNLSTQCCRLIFWVECSVGGYLALAKTIWVCHNSANASGNVIMLVEMAMVMLVVQCSQ
jgi:hypothetical protein